MRVYNDGSQVRAWCYVDDAVEALCRMCVVEEAVGESFNVGTPQSAITVRDLARLCTELAGSEQAVEFVPRDGPDVELRVPDVAKMGRILGFQPQVGLEEGLRRTIAWYREQA